MAKIKKKDKEKSIVEPASTDQDKILKSSKKTESTLHGLLKVVTEEKSFISPNDEEEKIAPQLSYETKKQIAEDYMMEQVPLSERAQDKDRTPISHISEDGQSLENAETKPSNITINPSFSKENEIYEKLTGFFEEVFDGYVDRYSQWENSISSILSILRKMRKITKKNTEELVSSISGTYEKIKYNLDQFKLKRDEVEKYADVNVESMSSEFKKVLGLLELQVKEYQLKKLSDEYIHRQQAY